MTALWLGGGYLVFMNLWLFLEMKRDKERAERKQWRTPETTLLSLAVLGGSLGGLLGMRVFHHKTRKPAFALGIPIILLVQLAAFAFALWKSGALSAWF